MKKLNDDRISERGAAGIKFLFVLLVLVLVGNAGINYVPVAYNGASFRQEMDTAVVKALGSSSRMKPVDIATASIRKATLDHNLPEDAFIEITPINGGVVEAHVIYTEKVNMLPFGLYKYDYNFDYVARPVGYLLKQ